MPKIYSNSRKEKWLTQYMQGKTIKQIAKGNCDVRTVKRAIEELQGRHAAQEAMTQLYREAFRGHIDRLNSALDLIIENLQLPDLYFTALGWTNIILSGSASQESGEVGGEGGNDSEQDEDVLSDTALIAEHLKNSKAWRALGDWNRSLRRHRTACGGLQIRSFEVLTKSTSLNTYEDRTADVGPMLHAENTGDLLCRTIVKDLSGGEDIQTVIKEIAVDDEHGTVLFRGTVLVEGIKESMKLAECRDSIVEALKALKDSPETMQVVNTFKQLEKVLPKVRNELRALRLMGVLPGQCRICRQFGL